VDTAFSLITIALGFVALVGGGEFLIRSSSKLAAAVGIPPLVIGLTVVAFATSAPELAVVIQSSFAGKTDLAIGNAVGSNIFNVLFVLGMSAFVAPLVVTARLVRLDVPLMIGASILLLLLSIDGRLGRWDGSLMFILLVAYIAWTIRESRKAKRLVKQEFAEEFATTRGNHLWIQFVFFIAGLALLVVGAHLTVQGCVSIAKSYGVSELIIGLTVIAIGTSLPEVVTSVVASYRGERDIAVGNVIGSNMFNILGVLGLGSIVAPAGIDVSLDAIRFDIPVMIVVAIVCLPIFFVGNRIARWEGGLLFAYYLAYTSYLILHATGHGFGQVLEGALVFFALPLTTLTILIGVYRYWRKLQIEVAQDNQ
jgi:cation:H+ antiporter